MKSLLLLLVQVVIVTLSFGQSTPATFADDRVFRQAVAKNLRFPAVAQRLGQSVRVYVGFTLTKEGVYQNVSVINAGPIDKSLKKEVDRLWRILPRQDPEYAGNYVIPIAFLLGENGPSPTKPIANQRDQPSRPGNYTLLTEVSVTGWVVCERKNFSE